MNKIINNVITIGHLALLILLPISSFLVQILTNRFGLSELITLWKEILVFVVMLCYLWELKDKLKQVFSQYWRLILATILALGFVCFSSIGVDTRTLILGFRVELYWVLFLVLSIIYGKVSDFKINFASYFRAILVGFGLVCIPALCSIVIGQDKFLTIVGFDSGWSATGKFALQSPNCHTIDTVNGGCRLNGGFSTPNSFAGYLLVILPLFALRLINLTKFSKNYFSIILVAIAMALATTFLILTYSRYAWIILVLYLGLGICHYGLKNSLWSKLFKFGFWFVATIPLLLVGAMLLIGPYIDKIAEAEILPHSIVRSHSTAGHYKLAKIALQIIEKEKPILKGYGLGQSGPIAKQEYNQKIEETPIIKNNVKFADDLLLIRAQLAVPENWYLQLILNGGIIYAILYCFVLFQLLIGLQKGESWQFAIALSGFGILAGNLYLHIFESPIIVFYLGILAFVSRSYIAKNTPVIPTITPKKAPQV